MGQYGDQPDFGTRARAVNPIGNADITPLEGFNIGSAALYIGTGGTLVCNVIGGNEGEGPNYTVFKNIPNGTFFPVIVRNVWFEADDGGYITTCSDIVALY